MRIVFEKNIIILMIVKFSLATLAVRLFAFFVGRYHRLRLVGQVALLRLVPKLHNHADDAVDDADDDADGVTLLRHHLTFLGYWFNSDMVLIMTSGMMMLMTMMPMHMMQMKMVLMACAEGDDADEADDDANDADDDANDAEKADDDADTSCKVSLAKQSQAASPAIFLHLSNSSDIRKYFDQTPLISENIIIILMKKSAYIAVSLTNVLL